MNRSNTHAAPGDALVSGLAKAFQRVGNRLLEALAGQPRPRWLQVALAAVLGAFSFGAQAAECRLADPNSNGEHVTEICWFQFDGIDLSVDGTYPLTFDMPDGSRLELDAVVDVASGLGLQAAEAPTWTGSQFSGSSGFYTIYTPNRAALYTPSDAATNATVVLQNIQLFSPDNVEAANNFELVLADAESTNNGESLDFGVAGGSPLQILEFLGASAANNLAYGPSPPGSSCGNLGWTDCVRLAGKAGTANAALFTTERADPALFKVLGQVNTTGGRQGFTFGMRWGGLRLRVALPEGRADPADQFEYEILNAAGDATGSSVTTGGVTLSPYVGGMAVMPGNVLALAQGLAGGGSGLARYDSTIACTNSNAGSATVLPPAGPYDAANPPGINLMELGDNVECTITNIPRVVDLAIDKSAPATVEGGEQFDYTLRISNIGSHTATGAVFTDELPVGITGVTAAGIACSTEAGGATCGPLGVTVSGDDASGYTVSGVIQLLPGTDSAGAGGSAVVITLQVDAPVVAGTVTNTARVALAPTDTTVTEPDTGNNEDQVDVEVLAGTISVSKAADPGTTGEVIAGQVITYTLTADVTGTATTEVLTLTDNLGVGLTFGLVTDAGAFTASGAGSTRTFTLPAGTLPGSYTVTYTATVNADATGSVGNAVVATNPTGGDPDPVCSTCSTDHPVTASAIEVSKSSSPADGTEVLPGDTLTYTLTAVVTNSTTTEPLTLTDTLGAGLGNITMTSPGAFIPSGSGSTRTFTLPAGTLPGTYAVSYTATVNADATGTVGNTVVATNPPGGDPDPVCGTCNTEHPVTASAMAVSKSSDPTDGTEVLPGDTLTYTLAAVVTNSATTQVLTLSDTLGASLGNVTVTDAGAFTASGTGNKQIFTLPAGTLPGSYAVTYTATVNADATGSVGNAVVATNPPGGDPDPICGSCTTEHPVTASAVSVSKSSDPADGTDVLPGDTLTYTLTAAVTNSATTEPLTLTDTLGAGLAFGSVTNAGAFTASGAGSNRTFTLPAGTLPGTYAVTYTATVDVDATGSVGNAVSATNPPGGEPDPICGSCTTEHPVTASAVSVSKSSDPADGTEVLPGDTLTYTLTAVITNSATTEPLTLTDTLGTGLGNITVTNAGAFTAGGSGSTRTFTLPAGTLPGTYAVSYTATVNADATGTVGNAVTATNPPGGDPDPVCSTCTTSHPVGAPAIVVIKSSDPVSGTEVMAGQTITYTVTADVSVAMLPEPLVLTDTLDGDLVDFTVTNAGAFAVTGAGSVRTFTLPAGTMPGRHSVSYTASVAASAADEVGNSVVVTTPGGDSDPDCTTCTTTHPLGAPKVTAGKTADPASGVQVSAGQVITYTLSAVVANAATLSPVVLSDQLGDGLTYVGVSANAGAFVEAGSGALRTFTLPAGTVPGTYAVSYTASVDGDAATSVGNRVTAAGGGDPADPDGEAPTCDPACVTEHPVERVLRVTAAAVCRADATYLRYQVVPNFVPASSSPLTLIWRDGTATEVATGEQMPLSGEVLWPGARTDAQGRGADWPGWVLEDGVWVPQDDGFATLVPQAHVEFVMGASVEMVVDYPPSTADCLTAPVNVIRADDDDGGTIEAKAGSPDVGNAHDNDALNNGVAAPGNTALTVLEPAAHPGVAIDTATGVISVAAGTPAGEYTITYRLCSRRLSDLCDTATITVRVEAEQALRIVKSASVREARIGDLLRYTLVVENVGLSHVVDGTVVDVPPAGFNYVEGSMDMADGDGAFSLAPGHHPLRIGGLDVAVGEQATIIYLLRVGAGVPAGVHVNEAVATAPDGSVISNVATAQVTLASDPMLDDSLVFGTVFDDRDGDGWQDSAKLTGLRVQGGFDAAAYVAGSTTMDNGTGMQPVTDVSAPLLHGMVLGGIDGRQSVADPEPAHQIAVRQRLREATFNDDFVLTSDQGVSVHMAADGTTRIERSGEAGRGLNAAAPTVERRVARVGEAYEVDYIIRNAGIDERGIPGVRIASVEGLLVETDQYGRYHLADVQGGDDAHGRNFILKVDPATLPKGSVFTTDNPRLRRVTPGLPVRFDFGVRVPVQEVPGGIETVELELGKVLFAPGRHEVAADFLPVVSRMAAQVQAHGGGEVVIAADGDEALAFRRADAVRQVLVEQLDDAAREGLRVSVRAAIDEPRSLLAGLDGDRTRVGTVLFDTDSDRIRAGHESLLDGIAAQLEAIGGGTVVIVGHTDVRGSHAYNTALGLRRARSVQQALAARLTPPLRERLRVETSNDPAAPVGMRHN